MEILGLGESKFTLK